MNPQFIGGEEPRLNLSRIGEGDSTDFHELCIDRSGGWSNIRSHRGFHRGCPESGKNSRGCGDRIACCIGCLSPIVILLTLLQSSDHLGEISTRLHGSHGCRPIPATI